MKAFRFPLQPLRVIREQREQTALMKYAAALRCCETAADQLHAASAEMTAAWAAFCDDLADGPGASQLCRTRAWCSALEARQKECAAALQAAKRAVEESQKLVMVASTEREALERFYKKALRSHDLARQRNEQGLLDEMGMQLSAFPGALRIAAGATKGQRQR